jgi:DNA-3-methyladenine glycosylase I
MPRCAWARTDLSIPYHDQEWGVPVHDDITLFEFLILEGAQAGLSWETILNKRERYREVFEGFDPARVAKFNTRWIERSMQDAGIIRNRLKLESSIRNAKAFLAVRDAEGSFDNYIWKFVEHKPLQPRRKVLSDIPAKTPISDAMSKDLKKRGFNFVGSTICYAFMQAVGMTNDHLTTCPRHKPLS